MWSWLRDLGGLVLLWLCLHVAWCAVFGTWRAWEVRLARGVVRRVRRPPAAAVVPVRRPIEDVAADVRRLRAAFERPGLRFAKWEGTRLAYDAALAEAADSLEIPHLLLVMAPGVELDVERGRVEWLLRESGLLLHDRAA